MTEEEWQTCDWLAPMLQFVRLRAGDRKLRLFACACCRLIWDDLPGDHCRRAVELGERYADSLVSEEEMEAARRQLNRVTGAERGSRARLAQAAALVLRKQIDPARVADWARTGREMYLLWPRQRDILRDLVPFRPPPPLPPSVRRWNDSAVVRLAQGVYEERAFDRLPILADALLDAGCDDEALLAHCRAGGEHACGCWAVDHLLGNW